MQMTSTQALGYRIAVDIGGTFTDSVLVDASNHILASAKTPTTPKNPTLGALAGVEHLLSDQQLQMSQISGFIHGTTLATNALIERRGAKVASITTAGFRDILEIGYERRYNQYDIDIDKPDLIVSRQHSFTIGERVSAEREVLQPLDTDAIDDLVSKIEKANIDAVAICFLHAYANPTHEQQLRQELQQRLPELVISISSEVSPEAREFDRLCTTVANSYIQPLMADYLATFARTFADLGLTCPILIMTAGGGMTSLTSAQAFPIRLVESGPAGGAILAAHAAKQVNESQVLSFDMGGTTAKLCLIDRFQPQKSRHFEIGRAERFIKGSGMPVRIPVLEMIEIGAGGGSIASIDSLGRIQVGPQSAGSEPGPAGFGKGGTLPTISDADISLGFIDPATFAEGRLQINIGASHQALQAHVGNLLGLNVTETAQGISDIVDENMAAAGRMHAVESGKDLADRFMIAFGGNGPLHATRVARRAGVKSILIPNQPGVGSAVGFLYAPIAFEMVKSYHTHLEQLDPQAINVFIDGMISEAVTVVRSGAPEAELTYKRSAFMHYHGQGHEIEVVLPGRPLQADDIAQLKQTYEDEYQRQFHRSVPGMSIEILNWSVEVATQVDDQDSITPQSITGTVQAQQWRDIQCDLTETKVLAGVFQRQDLQAGDQIIGPALIQEAQTTTLVSSDFNAHIDAMGNIFMQHKDLEVSRD